MRYWNDIKATNKTAGIYRFIKMPETVFMMVCEAARISYLHCIVDKIKATVAAYRGALSLRADDIRAKPTHHEYSSIFIHFFEF